MSGVRSTTLVRTGTWGCRILWKAIASQVSGRAVSHALANRPGDPGGHFHSDDGESVGTPKTVVSRRVGFEDAILGRNLSSNFFGNHLRGDAHPLAVPARMVQLNA
jgi:hypothetical protein